MENFTYTSHSVKKVNWTNQASIPDRARIEDYCLLGCDHYRRFGRNCCLHLIGMRVNRAWKQMVRIQVGVERPGPSANRRTTAKRTMALITAAFQRQYSLVRPIRFLFYKNKTVRFRLGLNLFLHPYFPFMVIILDAILSMLVSRLSRIRWSFCSFTIIYGTFPWPPTVSIPVRSSGSYYYRYRLIKPLRRKVGSQVAVFFTCILPMGQQRYTGCPRRKGQYTWRS
jgi:hypothetical protein